jgi:hypothetical protein
MGLDVKPNRVLDEVQCFLLCFPLGIAPLQGRHDCDKVTVLIPFDYTRELVDLHGSAKHANRDTEKVTSYLKRLLRRANAIWAAPPTPQATPAPLLLGCPSAVQGPRAHWRFSGST